MYSINNLIKSISIRGWITLLALIITVSVHAQESTLKGVIVDETNTPLIGATIQVKGGSTGAITDFDGNFTLKVKKGATISISYIGYKTQELKFNGQGSINIKINFSRFICWISDSRSCFTGSFRNYYQITRRCKSIG